MKILHLSDLHLNHAWLEWAKVQHPSYDLVCVSGDLLDIFSRKGHFWGVLAIKSWADRFPTALALCSGNHDASSPDRIPDTGLLPILPDGDRRAAEKLLLLERWMDALDRPAVVTDNRSKTLDTPSGPVVVTTLPYDYLGRENRRDLWSTGARLRKETKATWIVLHHEPPQSRLVGGVHGSLGLAEMIEAYRPQFVFSGHLHLQPYCGNFAEKIGTTWCFNPGVPDEVTAAKAATPNHISLDLKQGTATWCFTPPKRTVQEMRTVSLGL